MNPPVSRLRAREKLCYSVGDVGTNFFFQAMILYQTRFYTDTVGLSAVAVGTMFLVLRLADAVVDPAVGALSDRTRTRWGKFRPWILCTAVPYGLVFWLVYLSPGFGGAGKLIYAYLTYSLLMLLYSANNTPYSALMGVMTPDAGERTSIASYRFVAALIGQFIIQALALPLVAKFGGADNSARGWAVTMAIFGVGIVVFNLIVFAGTKERLAPAPVEKSSFREDLGTVVTCRPWIVLFVFTLLIFTTLVVRGSGLNYFFAYYLDPHALRGLLGHLGLVPTPGAPVSAGRTVLGWLGLNVAPDGSNVASVGLSLFFVVGSIIQIVGIACSRSLCNRFGKKTVFLAGLGLTTIATALVFWVGPASMGSLVLLSILWPIGYGPTVPLLWVMIADVADFAEWKTGRRATGFMFAGILFALKAGLGLGGALSGWLLALYGYVPNAAQSPHALLGIRLTATIFAAIPFAAALICLVLYPIGRRLGRQIEDELAVRRAQAA